MMNILHIALNHLKLLAKDKTAFLLLLALPLALTIITGLSFGGSSQGAKIISLAVVDLDDSELSHYLKELLKTGNTEPTLMDEARARELVKTKAVAAAVIINSGFMENLRRNNPAEIIILEADYKEYSRIIEQLVTNILFRLKANAGAALMAETLLGAPWPEAFETAAEIWRPSPPVMVVTEKAAVREEQKLPTGYQQSSPGYVVMFGMMTVIAAGASSLLEERQKGTLARILAAPVRRVEFMAGKLLGLMAGGTLQMLLLITAGQYFFNVNWGQNPAAVLLLVSALSYASTGFGLMLSSLSRTYSQAESFGVMSVVIMSMLGGSWWPIEVLPAYMQTIAKLVPSGWAMQGFTDLILRGGGFSQITTPFMVLTGFGTLFLTAGLYFFSFEK